MNEYLFFISDYLKGKAVSQTLCRILNILFSASLASIVFERYYFHYRWLDITDYKNITEFFLKGNFIIPASIFLIVHFLCSLIADLIFATLFFFSYQKLLKRIYSFKLTGKQLRKIVREMNQGQVVSMPEKINSSYLIKLYQMAMANISPKSWQRFVNALDKQKENARRNFKLTIKAVIAITVYFCTISYFGKILYVSILFVIISIAVLLWVSYIFCDIIPTTLVKFSTEINRLLEEQTHFENKTNQPQPATTQNIEPKM